MTPRQLSGGPGCEQDECPPGAARGERLLTGWLVATDVDHTLLDDPGEAALAGECLRRLHRRDATTLLASSKTFSEMVALQDEAGLAPQPFLFENGGGIGWPLDRWAARLAAAPHARLGGYGAIVPSAAPGPPTAVLTAIREREGLRFTLLGELSAAEIGRRLGLAEDRARMALERFASVPLVWHADDDLERLRRQLDDHGFVAVRGGRLVHVGPRGGKGETLERLLPLLADPGPAAPLRVLACGDGENDRSLLEAAAVALVFHPPDTPPLRLAAAGPGRRPLRHSVHAGGPRRWLDAVEAALAEVAVAEAGPAGEPR